MPVNQRIPVDKESKQKYKQTNKKLADVTPIPKKKPINDLKKDLHPISLAPCVSKIAEDFVICDHVKPTAPKYQTTTNLAQF